MNDETRTDATQSPGFRSAVERLRPDRTQAEHELAESDAPEGESIAVQRLRPSRESAD